MSSARPHIMRIFQAGLERVHGRRVTRQYLADRRFDDSIYIVAIGKASTAMAQGAVDVLGDQVVEGLVVSNTPCVLQSKRTGCSSPDMRVMVSSHPIPDERSLAAGEALLEFLHAVPSDSQLIFLISGGASALVEVLPPGISLEQLQAVNRQLQASGLPIHEMNRIRAQYSAIKGGKLVNHLKQQQVLQLLISDVPGDHMEYIGSGLLFPNHGIESHIIASVHDAIAACAETARALGYVVEVRDSLASGDAAVFGREFAQHLQQGEPRVLIQGGETTVTLPDQPGEGGRNQHAALAAAQVLSGDDTTCILFAGTDGRDGPGKYAGALVDGGTIARGMAEGLDAEVCLQRADSTTFLSASQDVISTGSTGTNVMDLVVGVRG